MTESDESNTAANILASIKNLEGSQRRANTRNDEQMAHLEQKLEILREELCQVRYLTKLNITTFPNSLCFPSLETLAPKHFSKSTHPPRIPLANSGLPSITLANMSNPVKQTPYVPNVTPSSPPVVRTAPNLSLPSQAGKMPAYPVMQHIPRAHVATSYESHVPLVYVVEAPAFIAPVIVRVPYEAKTTLEYEPHGLPSAVFPLVPVILQPKRIWRNLKKNRNLALMTCRIVDCEEMKHWFNYASSSSS
ncbi:hypothetical protein HAX54_001944 [Datura stramonium]|uniref:Uncharacterized protein n=1 Tax=Datura stramonium TaxID=4076 RepID=A0ABS8T3Y1_DATST|nr:hypothetical protein [Datura stramonium]